MNTLLSSFGSWLLNFFNSVPKLIAVFLGIVWAHTQPTIPYAIICVLAVLLDCLTAWRLHRRVHKTYPDVGADGKLKSSHMMKMISDLAMVWFCIILATEVDGTLLGHLGGLHLGQYVAAVFVLCTFVSILENESSCNGAAWAKLAQKILADKVSRHIEIAEEELTNIIKGNKEENTNESHEV